MVKVNNSTSPLSLSPLPQNIRSLDPVARPTAACLWPAAVLQSKMSPSSASPENMAPTASTIIPSERQSEATVLVATSNFKLKQLSVGTMNTRKTVLAPTLALKCALNRSIVTEDMPNYSSYLQQTIQNSWIHKLMFLNTDTLLAYANCDRVIGLIRMPLNGNPFCSMGVFAHACKVFFSPHLLCSYRATLALCTRSSCCGLLEHCAERLMVFVGMLAAKCCNQLISGVSFTLISC